MPQIPGVPFLTASDELLIAAAFGDYDAARAAWDAWQRDNSLDDVDPAAFAVLPGVSRNLDRLEIAHEHSAKLRGIYRYAWSHGQTTFRDLALVHQALADAGVQALAHRGVPVALRYLGDVAAVRSDQVDLLVAGDDLDQATRVLTGLGWSALGAIPSVAIRSAFAAHVFERAGRRRVVVHWRSFPLGTAKRDEVALIERAVTTQVQGIQLSVPDATDQLLLACAYFRSLAEVERVSWALETCAILRGTGDTLDERAFAERARAAGVLRECVAALDAIATATSARGLSVPVFSVAEAAVPGARREVRAPVRATGIRRALFAIGAGLRRYSAVCRSDGVTRTPWGYARFTVAFYRYEWGASGLRGLAMAGARRFLDGDDQPVVSRTL